MDNRRLWSALRSRWFVIIILGLVGAITGCVYLLVTPTQYTADAQLYVAAESADTASDLAQGGTYSAQQAKDYSAIVSKQVVLGPVISTLGLDESRAALARRVASSVPLNTSLIDIAVTDSSPARAAATANAIATSLTNAVAKLAPERSDGTTPVRLTLVERASAPANPSAPNDKVAILLGLLAGVIVGVVIVLLHEIATEPVRDADQARGIVGAAVLGSVVLDRGVRDHALAVAKGGVRGFRGEQYLQLSAAAAPTAESGTALVLTAATPGEGTSLTAANLAAAFAASGRSVCLVDANLRSPSIGRIFGAAGAGLSSVLTGASTMTSALQKHDETGVNLLVAGPRVPNPAELLASPAATKLFDSLVKRFDVVVFDTPAVLAAADAVVLADRFGGATLVASIGRVTARELRSATAMLASTTTSVLGIVLNRASPLAFRRVRAAYSPMRSTPVVATAAEKEPAES